VQYHSMINAGKFESDRVIVIRGYENIVKILFIGKNRVAEFPANINYKPITVERGNNLRITDKVKAVVRRLK